MAKSIPDWSEVSGLASWMRGILALLREELAIDGLFHAGAAHISGDDLASGINEDDGRSGMEILPWDVRLEQQTC
jgi:hypothetical protein